MIEHFSYKNNIYFRRGSKTLMYYAQTHNTLLIDQPIEIVYNRLNTKKK